jgi:adenylate kinase
MVVVMIGPPGCGKGTQSRLLSQMTGIPAFSTGDILRAEVAAGTTLGNQVRAIMQSGGLANDDLVNRVVATRLASAECANGAILDGYPRTVAQAEYMDRLLKKLGMQPAAVVHFEIGDEAIFERLSARRHCPLCGRVYNLVSQPPAHMDYCDDDGMVLVARKDDAPEVVAHRLKAFDAQTSPVLRHYRGRVHRVDAARPALAVLAEIESRLGISVHA